MEPNRNTGTVLNNGQEMCQATWEGSLEREDGSLALVPPGSPQCTCIFGCISLKHPEESRRYCPGEGELAQLPSSALSQTPAGCDLLASGELPR